MANYKTLFADPIFLGALKNTFVIVIVSVPITCISVSYTHLDVYKRQMLELLCCLLMRAE